MTADVTAKVQGKNALDIPDTQPDTPPAEAGYILEFEHEQNYDNVPTVNGTVYAPAVFTSSITLAHALGKALGTCAVSERIHADDAMAHSSVEEQALSAMQDQQAVELHLPKG